MPEKNSKEYSRGCTRTLTGIYSAIGAGIGMYVANTYAPAKVEFIPGIAEAEVSLKEQQGVSIEYGPTLDIPEVPADVPFAPDPGLHLDITQLNVSIDNPDSIAAISSLFSDTHANILEPIQGAIVERLAQGAGTGTVVGGALGYTGIQAYRQIKENGGFRILDRIKRYPRRATAIGAMLLVGCGAGAKINIDQQSSLAMPTPIELTDKITRHVPMLEGATITGAGAEIPNKFIELASEYVPSVNKSLEHSSENYYAEFKKYEARSEYLNNPDIITVAHLGDTHCNYATTRYLLKPVVETFKPSTIFHAGDIYTNSNTTFYERNCISAYRDSIKQANNTTGGKTVTYFVPGNHDPKEPVNTDDTPAFYTLTGNNSSYSTELGNVVGIEDRSVTKWETSPPEDSDEMRDLMIEQGYELADKTCEVESETQERPIAMFHRPNPEAINETILRGCASLVLNAHTHKEAGFRKFESEDGRTVWQHTAGSMSGTHNTFSIYETPKVPATFTMIHFDQYKNPLAYTTITFSPGEDVKIEETDLDDIEQIQEISSSAGFVKAG